MVGGYLLPWKPECSFLPQLPLSHSYFPLASPLPPSLFCTSTLSSLKCHVLGIWAPVSFM